MIVGHLSDLHGWLDPLAQNTTVPDLWIWTGDMLREDWEHRPLSAQPAVQHSWITHYAPMFAKWFHGKPVLVVNGNHDWIDPVPFLKTAGVDARHVTIKKQEVLGFTYAGFPHIPIIEGADKRDIEGTLIPWRYQTHDPGLVTVVDEVFADSPELLITHCPPDQILDFAVGRHLGIPVLTRRLSFVQHNVRYHFFGHIHRSAGIVQIPSLGVTFSNAACRLQFVEVTKP